MGGSKSETGKMDYSLFLGQKNNTLFLVFNQKHLHLALPSTQWLNQTQPATFSI
jgi:L-rhamnose mutarotase